MNQSKEMVKLAVEALEEKKGEDIKIIDIEGVSVIAAGAVATTTSIAALQTAELLTSVLLTKAGFWGRTTTTISAIYPWEIAFPESFICPTMKQKQLSGKRPRENFGRCRKRH